MNLIRLKMKMAPLAATVLLAGWGLFIYPALADKPSVAPAPEASKAPVRGTKLDLTQESFPNLHALVRPQDSEWRHLKVNWLTDAVAARKKAVAEDKPIVICYTGGAGYNEPLGVC
jgi:hypothetical protein